MYCEQVNDSEILKKLCSVHSALTSADIYLIYYSAIEEWEKCPVVWGGQKHLDPLYSECVGVTLRGSAGNLAPHRYSDLTHFSNPVGDDHTLIANGLQTRSTHFQLGGSTQLIDWPSPHSHKQLSQYQRILMEHKQPSESQRIRERGNRLVRQGTLKNK